MSVGVTNALDLFSKPPIQTAIVKGSWLEVRPTTTLDDDGAIDFEIPGSGTDYFDLANTFIKAKIRVLTPRGNQGYPEEAMVAPVNNVLHSMFAKADVMLNGKTVCSSDHHYAHRAFIETLLNFGSDTKKGELTAALWQEDTPGHFEDLDDTNVGFTQRRLAGRFGGTIALMGRIHADLFNQPRIMIDGVDIHVKLTRAPAAFCVMRAPAQINGGDPAAYRIKIDSISLHIRKIKPSTTCRIGIIEALKLTSVKYPIRRIEMRTFSIPNAATSWTQENILLGQLPRRVVFFFVGTNAVHGTYALNPMNLQHYNINFFSLYVDGRQIPSTALQPSFGENRDYVRTFMQMQSSVGTSFRDIDCGITYSSFARGSTVFAFDLTNDLSNGPHTEPTKRGGLRADVRFGGPTPHAVTCFVHAEYNNCIEINQDRSISLDYLL